ncbi:MAG: hypothetical protein A2Y73_00090 [Chloroflexi bacterium RBG_13_56_8]|nr:MAG: hypothetical protein A2Y73_00090 [Chloroflexi bacterium RBG_13_56_8]
MQPRRAVWLDRIALGGCVAIALFFALTQDPAAHYDDAYITYRYARNLANGQGFVYNSGEAVLGTTAPLYGLLLALIHKLGVDIPLASHWLGAVGWAACTLLVAQIARIAQDRVVALPAAALVSFSPLFLQSLGMETSLTIALALGAVYLYLSGGTLVAFFVAALATWMRPDSALVALVLGGAYIAGNRKLPWREGLIFVVTLLPWLLYAQFTYGTILPNSLHAKAGQGLNPFLGGSEFGTFVDGLADLAVRLYSISKLYVLAVPLGIVGLADAIRRRPRWIIVLAWVALYIASYALIGVLPFPWYYLPVWPAIVLLVASGITALARLFPRKLQARGAGKALVFILSILLVVGQVGALRRLRITEPVPYYRVYRAVGDWLRANTLSDASVAMIEIGIIGYYADRYVVDAMGLVSPDVTEHLYSWEQTLRYALAHYWPDCAIALQSTAWDVIRGDTWFQEAYAPVAEFPEMGANSRNTTVYQRLPGFPVRDFALRRSYNLSARDAIGLSAVKLQTETLTSGTTLHAQIAWSAKGRVDRDYEVLLDLVNAQDGQRWPLAEGRPMHGGNPTFLWRPGEVVTDDYSLSMPNDLSQGVYSLEVRLLDVEGKELVGFVDSEGHAVPHVAIGPLWVGPNEPPTYEIDNRLTADLAESIEFLGFDLTSSTFTAGEPVSLALYWRARELIYEDYTVFVHVVDGENRLVTQQDSIPLQGRLPTSLWLPGIAVRDEYLVALPSDLPPGEYSIVMGLYRSDTGERLAIRSSMGQVSEGALSLARIKVR